MWELLCKYKAMREQPRNVYCYRGSFEPNCYASGSPGDQSEGGNSTGQNG